MAKNGTYGIDIHAYSGNVTLSNDLSVSNALVLSNYAALEFADDTEAEAGGVELGGVYHTAGALKIRIA